MQRLPTYARNMQSTRQQMPGLCKVSFIVNQPDTLVARNYALWKVRNGYALASIGSAGIFRIDWLQSPSELSIPQEKLLSNTQALLAELLDGTIPCVAHGSAFQCRVWQQVLQIPAGATATYLDIARSAGSPRGSRAVGTAVGRNPLYLIIPCHRVVASDGSLGGYGWGLAHKQQLLACEARGQSWFVDS